MEERERVKTVIAAAAGVVLNGYLFVFMLFQLLGHLR